MSAAPVPSPAIKAICRTPVSFFQRLLEMCNYTEAKVFGFVLCQTVGYSRQWAEISWSEFEAAANVTRESVQAAVESLNNRQKLIRLRQIGRRTEYAVSPEIEAEVNLAGTSTKGRCPECHEIANFRMEFVAVPHAAYRKLGAAVDHATYCVVMNIVRNSLHWNGTRGLWSEWCELEINDLERDTGLSRRAISSALARALELGLIRREDRKGKSSAYQAIPEGFAKLEKRPARSLTLVPKEKANPNLDPDPDTTPKRVKTSEAESESESRTMYGQCSHCGRFAIPEAVTEQELRAAEDVQAKDSQPQNRKIPPRRETAHKKSKTEEIFDRLRKEYAS